MTLRFTADLDSRGKVQQPVQKLDVITIRPPKTGEPPDLPGVWPIAEAAGVPKQLRHGRTGSARCHCRVIGQIVKLRKGEMMINAGAR